jgi:hypothetical protein
MTVVAVAFVLVLGARHEVGICPKGDLEGGIVYLWSLSELSEFSTSPSVAEPSSDSEFE